MAKQKRVAVASAAKKGPQHVKQLDYDSWVNDYRVASKWMSQYDLESLVDEAGGLVRVENFLPEHIAEGILRVLERIKPNEWKETAATEDYTQNNISHRFDSTKQAKGLDAVTRLFTLLRPDSLHAFSAARYCRSDHIAPHDDRAYTQVRLDGGQVITASRTLAVIYYLTRDWRPEYGGVLLDLEDPRVGTRAYVPKWNSAVVFRVPRYHAVTALTTDRPRYSIFGWFLEPGKLYDLYRGEAHDRHVAAWPEEQKKAAGVQQGQQGQQALDGEQGKSGKRRVREEEGQGERSKRAATVQAKEGVAGDGLGRGAEGPCGRYGGGAASAVGGSKEELHGTEAAAREEDVGLGKAPKKQKRGAGDGTHVSQPGDGSRSAGSAGHGSGRGSKAVADEGQASGAGAAGRQEGAGGCTAGGKEQGRSRCAGRSGGGRPRLPEAWQGRRRHWRLGVAVMGRGPGAGRAQGRPKRPRR